MILPLIDENVLTVTRLCKKRIYGDIPNMEIELNKKNITCDTDKIKRLKI